jgi:hypothetical protein
MRRVAGVLGLALAASAWGCAYYNAMWSAEKLAKDARRLEARGQDADARTQWARAAVKAESVLVHHPHSRWADDALVLRAEGLARAGTCSAAAAPIAKALETVSEAPLRERAGLAAAQCALRSGKPGDADHTLAEALGSSDAQLRSRAEYLAGEGAANRYDYTAAAAHFGRSREPKALSARARALLAAGQTTEAAAVLDTVARGHFDADEWSDLLDGLSAIGGDGPGAAGAALDRLLARARVPFADRARLLIDEGDRCLARGDLDGAAMRYRQAGAAAPVGGGGVARTRELRVIAARAESRRDLAPVITELSQLSGPGTGGPEAQALLNLVERVAAAPAAPGAVFRTAELARDSLRAARLAGRLFLDLAAADSGSLFAPKALVAALVLLPDRHDSIVAVLDRAYGASPYTRALRGESSPAYAALEDSLARELGVEVARGVPSGTARARLSAQLTGPRGPWLDEPPSRAVVSPGVRGRPLQEGPALRNPAERPTRERPVVPPAAS